MNETGRPNRRLLSHAGETLRAHLGPAERLRLQVLLEAAASGEPRQPGYPSAAEILASLSRGVELSDRERAACP